MEEQNNSFFFKLFDCFDVALFSKFLTFYGFSCHFIRIVCVCRLLFEIEEFNLKFSASRFSYSAGCILVI